MDVLDGTIGRARLSTLAESIGGTYHLRGAADGGQDIYSGRLEAFETHAGPVVSLSDLVAEQSAIHCGTLPRFATIIFAMDRNAIRAELPQSRSVAFDPSKPSLIALSDESPVASSTLKGQHARLLKIHVQAARCTSPSAAEAAERLTLGTASSVFACDADMLAEARSLFNADDDPLIRLLRLEAFALSILARSASQDRTPPISLVQVRRNARTISNLDRVRDRILDDPGAAYSLSGLASDAGMSVPTLTRAYKQRFGVSVFEAIREARLVAAHEALRSGTTIAEASVIAGYAHIGNFSTAFSRRFGIPPSRVTLY